MDFGYGRAFTESSPEAYERLILDVLLGEPPLFPRHEEVELSWQILDPIEAFWAKKGRHPSRTAPAAGDRRGADDDDAPRRTRPGGCRDRRPAEARPPADVEQEAGPAARRQRRDGARPGAHPGHRGRRRPRPTRRSRPPTTPARQHPCRIIVVVAGNRRGAARLDAQIRVGGDAGRVRGGRAAALRRAGRARPVGRRSRCCWPTPPIVAWWPHDGPAGPVGRPDRRDGAAPDHRLRRESPRPARGAASGSREAVPAGRHRPGVDPGHAVARAAGRGARPAALRAGHRATVVAGASDSPSGELLAGWLAARLRCPVRSRRHARAAPGSSACGWSAPAARSTSSARDGNIATLSQPGQPDRTDRAGAPRRRRVPRRRAAPPRPRRGLRGRTLTRGLKTLRPARVRPASRGGRSRPGTVGWPRRGSGRPAGRAAREPRRQRPWWRPRRCRRRPTTRPRSRRPPRASGRRADPAGEGVAKRPAKKATRRRSAMTGAEPTVVVTRRSRAWRTRPRRGSSWPCVDAQSARGMAQVVLTGGRWGRRSSPRCCRDPGPRRRGLVAGARLVGRRAVPAGRRRRPQRHPERRGRACRSSGWTPARCTGSRARTPARAPRRARRRTRTTVRGRAGRASTSWSCSASARTVTWPRCSRTTRRSASPTRWRSPCTTPPSRRRTGCR